MQNLERAYCIGCCTGCDQVEILACVEKVLALPATEAEGAEKGGPDSEGYTLCTKAVQNMVELNFNCQIEQKVFHGLMGTCVGSICKAALVLQRLVLSWYVLSGTVPQPRVWAVKLICMDMTVRGLIK